MDFGTFRSWRYVVFVFQAFTLSGVDLLQPFHVSSKHWPGPFNRTSAISDTPCAGLSVGSPVFANALSHPLNVRVLIYSPWNDVNWTPWVSAAGTCADCSTRFGWTTLNSDELVSLLKFGERSSSVNVRLDTKIRIREEEERSNLEDQGLQLMWNTRKTFLLYCCSALVLVICGAGVEQVADRGYCWHLDVLQECWALKWYHITKSWVCIPFATLSFVNSQIQSLGFLFFLVPLWRRTNSAACWRSEQLLLHYQVSAFQLQTSAFVCWMPAAPNQLGWQAVGENMLLLIFCFYYPTQAMKRSKSTRACGNGGLLGSLLTFCCMSLSVREQLRTWDNSNTLEPLLSFIHLAVAFGLPAAERKQ